MNKQEIDTIRERFNKGKQSGLNLMSINEVEMLFTEIDRLQVERDAAVRDIPHNCGTCAFKDNEKCEIDYWLEDCEDWQWRGLERGVGDA